MKSKFIWTLTVTFVGLAALSAESAYSADLSCSDVSFNTPGCSAHITKTSKVPSGAALQNNERQLASCSDLSFNTPSCSAHIEKTKLASAGEPDQNNKQQLPSCSDLSFNTPGCPAHIN